MTEAKKPIAGKQERSEAEATSSQSKEEAQAAAIARYEEAKKALEALAQSLQAEGVVLEQPPTETTVVREQEVIETGNPHDKRLKPGTVINGVPRPWTKEDLAGQEKFPLVPKWIPGAVHPLADANGKFHIFLDVNNLTCCLTVYEMNVVSGMFYHAYMNMEEAWKATEEFKKKGPIDGPHVHGGWGGINTWSYVGEAPSSWIDIDGGYYQPGAEMPLEEIPEVRPV